MVTPKKGFVFLIDSVEVFVVFTTYLLVLFPWKYFFNWINNLIIEITVCYLQAFKREAVEKDADVTKRMLNIVRQLQANPEMFQACISQLAQDQQVALHHYLTT